MPMRLWNIHGLFECPALADIRTLWLPHAAEQTALDMDKQQQLGQLAWIISQHRNGAIGRRVLMDILKSRSERLWNCSKCFQDRSLKFLLSKPGHIDFVCVSRPSPSTQVKRMHGHNLGWNNATCQYFSNIHERRVFLIDTPIKERTFHTAVSLHFRTMLFLYLFNPFVMIFVAMVTYRRIEEQEPWARYLKII